jgi:septal ring factor EnvC (AmiA/AmiB activator)
MWKKLSACLCVIVISVTLVAQQQQPDNSEDLKKQQADIQREIDDLKNILKDTKKNTKAGLMQLEMVQRKLRLREKAIGNINKQINIIEGNITKSKNEVGRLQHELDTLKIQYAKSVVYAYKNRNTYDFLNFIFSAPSFNDALRRVEYLRAYRQYRESQAAAITNTRKLLAQKIGGLETTRKEKDEVLQKQQKQRGELEDEKKEKKDIVKDLKSHEKEITKELTDKQKADQKLRLAINAAIQRQINIAQKDVTFVPRTGTVNSNITSPSGRREANKSVLDATPEGIRISGSFEANKGRLPWPIDNGMIKIHFGPYKIEGIEGIRGNNPGLTLETTPGAAVKAVFEGEVSSVFSVEGKWTVLVRHGKYFTTYCDLSSVSVSRNDKVTAGQVLGKAGTNDSGNGQIDFILLQEKRNLDPERWIRAK